MTQKLKRYDPSHRGFNITPMDEDVDGEYVKYKDILPLIEALKFYDSNDIRSINFNYTDNGEKARQALASVGVE